MFSNLKFFSEPSQSITILLSSVLSTNIAPKYLAPYTKANSSGEDALYFNLSIILYLLVLVLVLVLLSLSSVYII